MFFEAKEACRVIRLLQKIEKPIPKHLNVFKQLKIATDYISVESTKLLSTCAEADPFKKTGFRVFHQQSNLRDAGDGLFLEGKVRAGTVVAFYPGIVFAPPRLWNIPHVVRQGQKNIPYQWERVLHHPS
eukprot:Rmarinus@m.10805